MLLLRAISTRFPSSSITAFSYLSASTTAKSLMSRCQWAPKSSDFAPRPMKPVISSRCFLLDWSIKFDNQITVVFVPKRRVSTTMAKP